MAYQMDPEEYENDVKEHERLCAQLKATQINLVHTGDIVRGMFSPSSTRST